MGQAASKDQLFDLLAEELRLDKGCIGDCLDGENTVLCLVEDLWLGSIASSGLVSAPIYDGSHTSVAWLQAAVHEHGKLLDGWQRVALRIILKTPGSKHTARVLVPACLPQLTSCIASGENIVGEQAHYVDALSWLSESVRHSQAAIVAGALGADGCNKSPPTPASTSVSSMFVQQVLDQLYGGVKLQQLEHGDCPSLVAMPTQPASPCCPGLLPVLCAVESSKAFYVFQSSPPPTLRHAIAYSPGFLTSSTSRPLFIIYQLLQILSECHYTGATHDNLDLDTILLDTDLWVQLCQFRYGVCEPTGPDAESAAPLAAATAAVASPARPGVASGESTALASTGAATSIEYPLLSSDPLSTLVQAWVGGSVSNFDYLMELNRFAGRRQGNPNQHPVLPWVVDFTESGGGWRDLSRSKFRLNKGDDQLDFTFASQTPPLGSSMSTSSVSLLPPHHVSDVLSDITYYVYLARRIPRSLLCRYVRSKWVPHEYPNSMHRMMVWTPDECIPELYTDPTVFISIHEDLADLELPTWAPTGDAFIEWHRSMLESDQVSENLHHWVDLTFGYQLSGRQAEKAKNVCLQLVQTHSKPCSHGVTQLFRRPHPRRQLAPRVSTESLLTSDPLPSMSETSFSLNSFGPASTTSGSDSPSKVTATTTLVSSLIFPGVDQQQPATESDPTADSQQSGSSAFQTKDTVSVSSSALSVSPSDVSPSTPLEVATEVASATSASDVADGEVAVTSEEDDVGQFEVQYPSTQVFEMKSRARPVIIKKEREERVPRGEADVPSAKEPPTDTAIAAHPSSDDVAKFTRPDKGSSSFFSPPAPLLTAASRPLGLFGGRSSKETGGGVPDCLNKTIVLPASAQPMVLLDSLEAMDSFLADCQVAGKEEEARSNSAEGGSEKVQTWPVMTKGESSNSCRPWSFVDRVRHDMQCMACVAVQMLLPGVRAMLLGEKSLQRKIEIVRQVAAARQTVLPSCVRHAVCVLLDLKSGGAASSSYVPDLQQPTVLPHSPGPQLSPLFSFFQFPPYFSKLYSFLRMLKQWRIQPANSLLSTTESVMPAVENDVMQTMTIRSSFSLDDVVQPALYQQSQVVSLVAQFLPQLLPILDAEAFSSLLLPQLIPLFSITQDSAKVAAEAMCRLFDILARRLGPVQTSRFFLKPLFDLFELMLHQQSVEDERSLSLLLNTGFLNQVVNRFGLASFLDHFVPALINIVTTPILNKPAGATTATASSVSQAAKASVDEESEMPCVVRSAFVQLCADALLWLSQLLGPTLSTQYITHALMNQLYQCFPVTADVVASGRYSSRHAMSAVQCLVNIVILYGEPLLLDDYIKRLLEMIRYNLTAGGVLTIKEQQRIAAALSFFRTLLPLMSQHILLNRFEKFHDSLFYPTIKLLSSTVHCFPGGVVARSAICHLMVDTLVVLGHRLGRDEAQHLLELPLQQLFACFDPFAALTKSDMETLRRSDSPAAMGAEEVRSLFTPSLAHAAYIPFCQLIGQIRMRELIINHELIEQLAYSYDTQQADSRAKLGEEYHSTWQMLATMSERAPVISSSYCVLAVGETLSDVEELDVDILDDAPSIPAATAILQPDKSTQPWTVSIDQDTTLVGDMKELVRDLNTDQQSASRPGTADVSEASQAAGDLHFGTSMITPGGSLDSSSPFFRGVSAVEGHRHLAGSWLDQWHTALGGRMWPFTFQQRKLQTFGGHSGTVRCMHVHPQEHLLLSGGRDKTVRLWSLANHGDGSSCISSRHDYRRHQKPVSFVHLVERTGAVASFDGTLHLWDPESGHRLKLMEFSRNVATIAPLPAPYPHLATATSDGILKFIDVRIGRMQHEYKLLTQAGPVRSLCADAGGHVIAVGYSTGYVSLLEQRTGTLLAFWRAHDADVLQIRSPAEHHLVTSSTDQTIALWQDSARLPGDRMAVFRGHSDPVHCLSFLNEHIISVSTGNRLGVHSSMDEQATFQSWKIKNEIFKGGISSVGVLPLNKLLLLAGDSGQIALVS